MTTLRVCVGWQFPQGDYMALVGIEGGNPVCFRHSLEIGVVGFRFLYFAFNGAVLNAQQGQLSFFAFWAGLSLNSVLRDKPVSVFPRSLISKLFSASYRKPIGNIALATGG